GVVCLRHLVIRRGGKGYADLYEINRTGDHAERCVDAGSPDIQVFPEEEGVKKRITVELLGEHLFRLIAECCNAYAAAEEYHIVVVPAVGDAPLIGGPACPDLFLLKWDGQYVAEIFIVGTGRVEQCLRADQV